MTTAKRISASDLKRQMDARQDLLLVCAYDEDEKYREMALEGSISWKEFEGRMATLPLDQGMVFYCG